MHRSIAAIFRTRMEIRIPATFQQQQLASEAMLAVLIWQMQARREMSWYLCLWFQCHMILSLLMKLTRNWIQVIRFMLTLTNAFMQQRPVKSKLQLLRIDKFLILFFYWTITYNSFNGRYLEKILSTISF